MPLRVNRKIRLNAQLEFINQVFPNYFKMKSIQIISLLSFLLFVCSKETQLTQQANTECCENDHTLSIIGTGRISIPTNVIKVGFSIETQNMNLEKAFSDNNSITARVNDVLINQENIPDERIRTVNFRMFPKYTSIYHESTRSTFETFEGFVVQNQIEVRVLDQETATRIVDKVVKAGVTKINYINFEVHLSEINSAKRFLIAKAVKDAYKKAKVAAYAGHVQIVDVISINVNDQSENNRFMSNTKMSDVQLESSVNLYPGEQEVVVNVYVVFKISKEENKNKETNNI